MIRIQLNMIKILIIGARDRVQLVECSQKSKVDSQHLIKPTMVAHVCKASIQEVEVGGSEIHGLKKKR